MFSSNDAAQPTLAVSELLGTIHEGGLVLHGPAAFANLVSTPFNASKEPPALTWVTSYVDCDRDQLKKVSLGWIGQA